MDGKNGSLLNFASSFRLIPIWEDNIRSEFAMDLVAIWVGMDGFEQDFPRAFLFQMWWCHEEKIGLPGIQDIKDNSSTINISNTKALRIITFSIRSN